MNDDLRVVAGRARLAKRLGSTPRVIWRDLQALKRVGVVSWTCGKGRGQAMKISVHIDRLAVQQTVQQTVQQSKLINKLVSESAVQQTVQQPAHSGSSSSYGVIPAVTDVSPSVCNDYSGRRASARETPPLAPPKPTAKVKPDPTPHLDFERLYAELCPRLIHCREFTKHRQEALRWAWRKHPDLDYWRDVMTKANKSDFCSGGNDRGWRCDIEFIMRHHVHIAEGRYDNKPSRWTLPAVVSQSVHKPDPSQADLGTPDDAVAHFGGFRRDMRGLFAVGSKPVPS